MGRERAFEDHFFLDLWHWGAGGFLAGGVIGFVTAEIAKLLGRQLQLKEVLQVANRDAYRGAVFFGLVAVVGHALRAIF
jgi:hypothetical protein